MVPEWTACELFEDDRCNTQSKREKDEEGLVVPEWTASFDCLDFQEDRREGRIGGILNQSLIAVGQHLLKYQKFCHRVG